MFFSKYTGQEEHNYPILLIHKSFTYLLWALILIIDVVLWKLIGWSVILGIILGVSALLALISFQFTRVGTAFFGVIIIPKSWAEHETVLTGLIRHEEQHFHDQEDLGRLQFLTTWLTPTGCAYLEGRGYYHNIMLRQQLGYGQPDYYAKYYSQMLHRLPYLQSMIGSWLRVDVDKAFYEGLRSKGLNV